VHGLGERAGLGRDLGAARLLKAREVLSRQEAKRPFICSAADMSLRLIGLDVDGNI